MLELQHIKKSYDGVTILEDINLKIKKGEIVSILGPSGCGKTTLLNLILGLTEADQGKILFEMCIRDRSINWPNLILQFVRFISREIWKAFWRPETGWLLMSSFFLFWRCAG